MSADARDTQRDKRVTPGAARVRGNAGLTPAA
jgi:hypothetical protein